MELKIISDGTHAGTRIENAKTGERVTNVRAARITIIGAAPPVVECVFVGELSMAIQGDAQPVDSITFPGIFASDEQTL